MWIYPLTEHVVLAGNPEDIGAYSYARHFMDKTFCKKCGVPLTNRGKAVSDEDMQKLPAKERAWAPKALEFHPVNIRTLDGVDFGKLTMSRAEGAKLWPDYENP